MDNEQPHQELVKCVLVGDTAVGKTRLICARACNKHVSLSQLLTTHVPTVFAIDQYRIYKDVLERSWEVVDSVNVSLRLWDTFGDINKDRRFAYGRSDVILLCFSIANRVSLRNCRLMWYPEIRRFCPQTPVILVGCKNDLRYMYKDETYLSYFGDRSPFIRAVRKSDLIMPDEARAVAKDLGIPYYESSVLTYFGVNEVFENAIRAALINRRRERFWMTNLKRVQKPILQAPFRPPKPATSEMSVLTGTYSNDMLNMLKSECYTDLVLVAGNTHFKVHRFVLQNSSNAFNRLLNIDISSDIAARSSSESSVISSNFSDSANGDFNEDTEFLIKTDPKKLKCEKLKRRCSYQTLPIATEPKNIDLYRDLHHSVFQNIRVVQMDDKDNNIVQTQTIVTLCKIITAKVLRQCLIFIYTGTIDKEYIDVQEIKQAAKLLDLPQLLVLFENSHFDENFLNDETILHYSTGLKQTLEHNCINGAFTDITFELDDGRIKAHRAILVARCEVMKAMLNGNFAESHARTVCLPGVKEYSFHKLLCYIYSDEIPAILAENCLNLLELANRLCLPRLLNLIECRVVENLMQVSQCETIEAVDLCLKLLEPVKLYNAHQLAEYCMQYLSINYNVICKHLPKSLKLLHPDNQEYLKENRWPPVWYLKDYDYYQRCLKEQNLELNAIKKNCKKDVNGCSCFSAGRSRTRSAVNIKITSHDSTSLLSNLNSVTQLDLGVADL